jgi:predicted O-methyltransferase YrrM
VEAILDRRWIDLLYIDGDHSYEGVLTDLEMYSALVRNGGAVMMDDIDNTTSAPGST